MTKDRPDPPPSANPSGGSPPPTVPDSGGNGAPNPGDHQPARSPVWAVLGGLLLRPSPTVARYLHGPGAFGDPDRPGAPGDGGTPGPREGHAAAGPPPWLLLGGLTLALLALIAWLRPFPHGLGLMMEISPELMEDTQRRVEEGGISWDAFVRRFELYWNLLYAPFALGPVLLLVPMLKLLSPGRSWREHRTVGFLYGSLAFLIMLLGLGLAFVVRPFTWGVLVTLIWLLYLVPGVARRYGRTAGGVVARGAVLCIFILVVTPIFGAARTVAAFLLAGG
jgi:hypothetical protein